MTDTGIPRICHVGDYVYPKLSENMRWRAPEALSFSMISAAPAIWSFGMTIYVRL